VAQGLSEMSFRTLTCENGVRISEFEPHLRHDVQS
jgi:hypothetical protein